MHPYQRGLASIMGLGAGKFIETERLVGVALAQLVCSQHGHLVNGVQVPSGNTRNETKPPPEAKRGRATGCVKEPSAARQRGKLFCDSRATLWETGWRTGADPGTVHMAARNRRGYRRMGQNEIVRHALNNRWLETWAGMGRAFGVWVFLSPASHDCPGHCFRKGGLAVHPKPQRGIPR